MANGMVFGHLLEELNEGVTVFRNGAGKPMPLSSTEIDISIRAGLAVVVTTRTFTNAEDVPIEAVLTMPVGFNAVVTGLSAQIDGRKLRAVAKAKDAAREAYEGAISRGKMAVLHEEVLRGIHVLSIGQLAPGKQVSVELRTVLPLTIAGSDPFLRIPVTAGQLYGVTPLQPADDLITDRGVKHSATLRVRTDSGAVTLGGSMEVASGAVTEILLNKAIEIVVKGGAFGSLLGNSAEGNQVRVTTRPVHSGEKALKLAILVDRSGSTNSRIGDRSMTVLAAMRHGLYEAMAELRDEDYIALWQFSDLCQRLGTGAGREALQLLKKLNDPSGGTNLPSAIQKVAASGIQNILVLTDGQTWGELAPLAASLNVTVSSVLVGKASLDANIGHFCAMTGGDLFYAPDAIVSSPIKLALGKYRSGSSAPQLRLEAGKPFTVSRTIGGVEVSAHWSDAMELGGANDIGRYAASLCIACMPEAEAKVFAVAEGLCSHLTSLLLIDDVGEATDGISETRKVPLMAEDDVGVISLSFDFEDDGSQLSDFIEDRNAILPMDSPRPERARYVAPKEAKVRFGIGSLIDRSADARDDEPSLIQRSVARERIRDIEAATLQRLGSRADRHRKLRSFLDDVEFDRTVESSKQAFTEAEIADLAERIDWEGQTNKLLLGDYSGLLDDETLMLAALVDIASAIPAVTAAGANGRSILLAYLALRFVTHSAKAKLFAAKVFDGQAIQLIAEIDEYFRKSSG